MKKLLILGGLTLLAGCTAGMKDSFDCNATAQDSCLTMEEANLKAQQSTPLTLGTGGPPSKRPELPRLVPMASSSSSSLTTPRVPVTTTAPPTRSTALASTPLKPVQAVGAVSSVATVSHTVAQAAPPQASASITWATWADIGMAPPVRLPSTTARLWIAPWVDEADTLYQPAVISFVVKDGQWKELVP